MLRLVPSNRPVGVADCRQPHWLLPLLLLAANSSDCMLVMTSSSSSSSTQATPGARAFVAIRGDAIHKYGQTWFTLNSYLPVRCSNWMQTSLQSVTVVTVTDLTLIWGQLKTQESGSRKY
jgi:hypothetical protein